MVQCMAILTRLMEIEISNQADFTTLVKKLSLNAKLRTQYIKLIRSGKFIEASKYINAFKKLKISFNREDNQLKSYYKKMALKISDQREYERFIVDKYYRDLLNICGILVDESVPVIDGEPIKQPVEQSIKQPIKQPVERPIKHEVQIDDDGWQILPADLCKPKSNNLELALYNETGASVGGVENKRDVKTWVHQMGLGKLEMVPGDGNCQFTCISLALKTARTDLCESDRSIQSIKNAIITEMKYNRNKYEPFITCPFDQYIERLEKNGTYGDELTLRAAANWYGISILVCHRQRIQDPIYPYFSPIYGEALFYYNGIHYDYINTRA